MDSIYCHFDNLRNFEHYERTDERKEVKKMKIEIEKEDFVRLAVYASCADLPDEENKCGATLSKIMDSLDENVAGEIAGDMLALRAKIELLNGANVEDLLKAILENMAGDNE